ncbi:MAG: hypothetical protein NTX79_06865 [Candidatus Micrarchaeota archaeon]|nr:hypothetical protein [Candidatus Micrarchaeota archaeon]
MAKEITKSKASASASDSGKGSAFIANKLERLGQDMLAQIDAETSPTFTTALRSKGNIIYDNGVGFIRLGDKVEERTFINVGQARKFMQTVAIASKCKKFLKEDAHTSIRGLYYQLKFSLGDTLDEELFSEQSESNPLVEDLEVALNVKREDLNLNTDRKGVVAGPMVLKDRFGGDEVEIDCTKQGRSGWMIPSDVDNGMEFKSIDADYVLVVEKDAMWQRLNEDKFWRKENCILITPKGQASRGCRRLIRKLASRKLPVIVFSVDADEPIMLVDSEGMIRNERIGEYCKRTFEKNGCEKTPHYEKGAASGEMAPQVDSSGAATTGSVLHVVRHPIGEKLFEVKSACGYSVKVTRSHSVMVFDEAAYGIMPKKASELQKGDLLVAPLKVPNNESLRGGIDLLELGQKAKCDFIGSIKTEGISIRFGKSKLRLPRKIRLTPQFARLLGYYVAEGSGGAVATFSFGTHEREYIRDVVRAAREIFGCTASLSNPSPGETQVKFGGKLAEIIFADILGCGTGADRKQVPGIIFNMPNDLKLEFLRGYFRGDGNVHATAKGCRLWANTVSRKLASDLVLLLLQLGCFATIEQKKPAKQGHLKQYHVLIYNLESLKKLQSIAKDLEPSISSHLGKKMLKSPIFKSIPTRLLKPFQKMIYSLGGKGISDTFNQDTISLDKLNVILSRLQAQPVVKRDAVLKALGSNPGSTTKELCRLTGLKFITVFKSLSRAQKRGEVSSRLVRSDRAWKMAAAGINTGGASEKLETLRRLAQNGIALIPVKEVAEAKASDGFVYDIEVNPTHTFVGGVGPLLLHNTDCDAWGWYIYWAIKTGSMNLAYLGNDIATPEARFVGVTMRDIKDYDFLEQLTINAKEVDIKRAEEMLSYEWISCHKDWVEELKTVLKTKKKIEQDALQGPRLSFVGDYLREKIEKKKFLA